VTRASHVSSPPRRWLLVGRDGHVGHPTETIQQHREVGAVANMQNLQLHRAPSPAVWSTASKSAQRRSALSKSLVAAGSASNLGIRCRSPGRRSRSVMQRSARTRGHRNSQAFPPTWTRSWMSSSVNPSARAAGFLENWAAKRCPQKPRLSHGCPPPRQGLRPDRQAHRPGNRATPQLRGLDLANSAGAGGHDATFSLVANVETPL